MSSLGHSDPGDAVPTRVRVRVDIARAGLGRHDDVDNKASEAVAKDPVLNNGMKHVNRRHYFAKEAQLDGEVKFEWVETKGNLADALAKALALPQFQALARCGS